jgi:hypothetical protein
MLSAPFCPGFSSPGCNYKRDLTVNKDKISDAYLASCAVRQVLRDAMSTASALESIILINLIEQSTRLTDAINSFGSAIATAETEYENNQDE